MKKLFLSAAILFFTINLLAQDNDERKYFFIGGNLSFAIRNNTLPSSYSFLSYSSYDYSQKIFSINPYIGKELNNNFFIGFQINYKIDIRNFTKVVPSSYLPTNKTITTAGLGGFARYCFNPQHKFKFFLQATTGYNSIKKVLEEKAFANIIDQKSIYFDVNITSLLLFEITSKIHITAQFGKLFYQIGETDFNTENTGITPARERMHFNAFGLNVNASSLFFGIEYQF